MIKHYRQYGADGTKVEGTYEENAQITFYKMDGEAWKLAIKEDAYDLIFTNSYWVATRCTECESSSLPDVKFGMWSVNSMGTNYLKFVPLFTSGNTGEIRPVVTIDSKYFTSQDSNGIWQLDV